MNPARHEGPLALALGGGGSRGSFQIGALRYLYDVEGITADIICGSSVGGVLGAVLAQADGHAGQRAGLEVVQRVFREVEGPDGMYREQPWFSDIRTRLPEVVSAVRQLRGVDGGDADGLVGGTGVEARGDVPADEDGPVGEHRTNVLEMFGNLRLLGRAALDLEHSVRAGFASRGVATLDPVREQLQDPAFLEPAAVAASGVVLRLGVVELESGHLCYVTEDGTVVGRDGVTVVRDGPVDLVDGVVASSSVPGVFAPMRMGDRNYVDGGIRQVLPFEPAVEALGAGHCYAIAAGAVGVPPRGDFGHENLLGLLGRSMFEIMADELARSEFVAAERDPRVTLIAPEFDVHGPFEVEPGLMGISMDHGWMRAADVVADLPTSQRALTDEIIRLRRDLWNARRAGRQRSPDDEAHLEELLARRDPAGLPPHQHPATD